MSIKKTIKGEKSGRVIISSSMPNSVLKRLHQLGDDYQASGGEKHALFCDMFLKYAKAWQKGRVPRMHIGLNAEGTSQQSFYVADLTREILQLIAQSDGVSVSQVARTAICWNLHHKERAGKKDIWGAEEVLGPRADFEIP